MLNRLSQTQSRQANGFVAPGTGYDSDWADLLAAPRANTGQHVPDVDHFLIDAADFAATHGGQVDGTLFIDMDGCR